MADFVHLHVHSEYSLLDGLSKIPKLVSQAKIMGMKHLALTDHGALYGAIKFYKECKQEGINPIIGCEMYVAKRKISDKESGIDSGNFHLTVLTADFEGYNNLIKLVTISHLEGFYYRPRIDQELLSKYAKGLIVLSGCSSSEISKALIENNFSKAQEICNRYRQIFGKNNFYLEIQRHLFDKFTSAHEPDSEITSQLLKMSQDEKETIAGIKRLSKQTGVKIVATNDVHYVVAEDAPAQDAIVCIQTGKTIAETKRLRMIDSPTYYLKGFDEMQELFADLPEAVTNSLAIAQMVDIKIPLGKIAFPKFEVEDDLTANEYLKKISFARIPKRVDKVTKQVEERLHYELSVISQKGYSTYFLVVADFVNWAREKGIVSTTRGSASGSLVSYALGITTVNPLYFKLPFERFLNLYRPTLPDIDVDFADNRRDEVIEYVRQKYGQDKVAQIGTFGTMMARQAIRDVARVLSWPYVKADRIAKMIPFGAQGFHVTLSAAKKQNPELGNLYNQDGEVRELLDLAEKVEGNARHVSVHAAGVVIAPEDLTNYSPLQREISGQKMITQYDMYDIEEIGLVKMDFLGIRNLSILGHVVEIVAERYGQKIDLNQISFDDQKAFKILAEGKTMGLFQLSGSGMTRYLKELRPTNIFDIMAMISLFRPGPMNSIPEFIERKNNSQKIQYYDRRMAEYLDQSYGVIVYQDDVLLTAINLAGYSWEEADKFRKAMGKKIPTEMTKQKEKFTQGCTKNGMTQAKAEELFKIIEPFAAYGFNKAHAASYAVIAYQTAYMKANYPVEFMAAVMTAEADDGDKIASAVDECAKIGIPVLPPDINKSQTDFTIEKLQGSKAPQKESIRFGLSAIKNVGKAAIEAILSERETNGHFRSIDDFVKRVNLRAVNRKTMESLIKAGAMDLFGKRNAMIRVLDEIKASGTSLAKTIATGQGSLFDEVDLVSQNPQTGYIESILNSVEEAPKEEILSWERELLGFYLTEHPLLKISDKLSKVTTTNVGDIDTLAYSGKTVTLAGIIISIRKTFTKMKKEEMCFVKLQDMTGTIEIIIFPRVYDLAKTYLMLDQIVVISGKLEESEETPIMIAEAVKSFEEVINKSKSSEYSLEITIPRNTDRVLLSKIYQVLKSNQGDEPVHIILPQPETNASKRKIPVPFGVQKTEDLIRQLSTLGCQVLE